MQTQNYKNHSRYVPLYHFITALLLIVVLTGSIVNFFNSPADNKYTAALIIVISILLIFIWWFSRLFALKAQDRAIRAEENFRHFVLTGKPHHSSLTINQVIALRFAGDEEFAALAKKAVDEKLDVKTIKSSIKNWRGDYDRA